MGETAKKTMGRKPSSNMKTISTMLKNKNIDSQEALKKASELLDYYRIIKWECEDTITDIDTIYKEYGNGSRPTGEVFAEEFAGKDVREKISGEKQSERALEEILCLYERIIGKIESFPDDDGTYAKILRTAYMTDNKPSNKDAIGKELGMERSVFYQKLKEAKLLFVVLGWNLMPYLETAGHLI